MAANGSLEHPAQRHSIHDAAVDAEADDAPSKLIHHHQNPMRSQDSGLAAKQIATPQAVLGVAEEGEPGGTSDIRFRPVMIGQDPANDVLVDPVLEQTQTTIYIPRQIRGLLKDPPVERVSN